MLTDNEMKQFSNELNVYEATGHKLCLLNDFDNKAMLYSLISSWLKYVILKC